MRAASTYAIIIAERGIDEPKPSPIVPMKFATLGTVQTPASLAVSMAY